MSVARLDRHEEILCLPELRPQSRRLIVLLEEAVRVHFRYVFITRRVRMSPKALLSPGADSANEIHFYHEGR
jgi:hypothetical protein